MRPSLLVVLAAGLACGGKAGDPVAAESPQPGRNAPSSPPDSVTRSPSADVPAIEMEPSAPVADDTPIVDYPEGGTFGDLLQRLCGDCHAEQRTPPPPWRREYPEPVFDVDVLVEIGWIVPLDSAASPLVRVMLDGSMPPPGVQPRPSPRDITRIANYIDNPDYWDLVETPESLDAGAMPETADGG